MWFGTSTLQPGERGDVDPGHATSVEVFYCCQGRVIMNDGERDYELPAGEAVIVPEGLPHALTNVGDATAILVWAGAPGEGCTCGCAAPAARRRPGHHGDQGRPAPADGSVVASASRDYELLTPSPAVVEVPAATYWRAFTGVVHALLRDSQASTAAG